MKLLDENLKREKREYVTMERNNILAANQKRTLDKILENSTKQEKTIENLQREINQLKSNHPQKIEFCCANCLVIHDMESCPNCNSRIRRIYDVEKTDQV